MDPVPRTSFLQFSLSALLLYHQIFPGTALFETAGFYFPQLPSSNSIFTNSSGFFNGSLFLAGDALSLDSVTPNTRPISAPASISTNFTFKNPHFDQLWSRMGFIIFFFVNISATDLPHSPPAIKNSSIFSLESKEEVIRPQEIIKLKKGNINTAGLPLNALNGKIQPSSWEEQIPQSINKPFVKNSSISHQTRIHRSLVIEVVLPLASAIAITWMARKVADRARFRKFKLIELCRATNQFDRRTRISRGTIYDLHCTRLPNSPTYYVLKRFKLDARSRRGYLRELSMITSLRHGSILELSGWCDKFPYENLLAYEFMPKGNLTHCLQTESESHFLDWSRRRTVAIKVAEAVHYLHEECLPSLVHGDIRSKNVFLDADFEPKLANCGLSLRGPPFMVEAVSWAYSAPECRPGAEVDEKADVYSYGVLLLEICCGRTPAREAAWFVNRFRAMETLGRLLDSADRRIARPGGMAEAEEIVKFLKVGLACTRDGKERRPSMLQVLRMLKGEEDMQQES